jgi:hypothetical protein
MSAMRIGVLLWLFLSVVCLAGRPLASAQVAAEAGSVNSRQRPVRPPGPTPYFGPRLDSHFEANMVRDALLRHPGFPNPFLLRFLPDAGFGPKAYAQWRSRLHPRDTQAGNRDYFRSPGSRSESWCSYDGAVMQTIGTIGYFVVPAFLPPKALDAFERAQDSSPPGGHGWPYHR